MRRSPKLDGLRCPYCEATLPSNRALRIHVGRSHTEKIDDFMAEFFGGRSIEVDFMTLMLQRAIAGLSPEYCAGCGKCDQVCPATRVNERFAPMKVVEEVRLGRVKELMKSDLLWFCSSCLACKDQCPDDTSPFDVIRTLWNLSARIDYHLPKIYREFDRRVSSVGVIQEDQIVQTKSGERLTRSDLPLPSLRGPEESGSFSDSLKNLKSERINL